MSLSLFTVFSMSYLLGNGKGDPGCCGGQGGKRVSPSASLARGSHSQGTQIPRQRSPQLRITQLVAMVTACSLLDFFSTCKYRILYFTSVKISIRIRFELDTGRVPTGVFVTETRNASVSFSVRTQTLTGVIFHFKTLLVAWLKCLKYSAFRF